LMESVLSISLVPFNLSPPVSLLPWFPRFYNSIQVNTGIVYSHTINNTECGTLSLHYTTMLRLTHTLEQLVSRLSRLMHNIQMQHTCSESQHSPQSMPSPVSRRTMYYGTILSAQSP